AFLPRLADRRALDELPAIDVAAGEHPLPVARFDRAPDEDDPTSTILDDRAHRDFRIEIEHEPTAIADEAIGIAGLQRSRRQRASARRAEAKRVGHDVQYCEV